MVLQGRLVGKVVARHSHNDIAHFLVRLLLNCLNYFSLIVLVGRITRLLQIAIRLFELLLDGRKLKKLSRNCELTLN